MCRAPASTPRSRRGRLAWLASSSGPSTDRSPVGSAVRRGEHARVLGDDVPRARDVAHLVERGVAQRPRCRARPRPPRTRRGVTRTRSPRACGARRECTTTTAIPGGIATGVTRQRRGSRSGGHARPGRRARRAGPSAHPARRWRRSRPSDASRAASTPATGAPARSARDWVSATASAELDDSPEPTGTVELIASSAAATRTPAVGRAPVRPRPRSGPRSARPCAGSSLPSAATSTAPGDVVRDGGHPAIPTRRDRGDACTPRSIASGRTKPAVVVGVVAHEVHPTRERRSGPRRRRVPAQIGRSDFTRARSRRYWWPMTRFQTSWEIAKRSWAVLKSDKTLAWFPVLSALGSLAGRRRSSVA